MTALFTIAATLTWFGCGYCLTRGETPSALAISVPATVFTVLSVAF